MVETSLRVSEQIAESTKQYLLETLEPGFYAADFSQEHFDLLLNRLTSEYGEEHTLSRIETIRSSIYKHFRSFEQECKVSIDDLSITIVNELKDGVRTAEMDRALIGLDISLKSMFEEKEEYALQEYLLCYPKELVSSLYQRFSSTELEEDYAGLRDTIRARVQDSFQLGNRDIVIFLRKNLYIRYFVDLRASKEGENRRFLGMSADELEAIYTKNFPDDFEEILLELAIDVIEDALNFSRIDNLTFKTKYIEVFRALVDVAMVEYTNGISSENVKALNGYILRIHFDALLYRCAEILIDKVMQRDKKADKFLHYYNGEIVVGSNGKKLTKPFITDIKGNIWNYGSIFSVMTQCARFEENYDQQVEAIRGLQDSCREAASLVIREKQNDLRCGEELRGIRQKLDACTLLKNNLASIAKPSKEESAKLRDQKAEERVLLDEHAKIFAMKNDTALKLENAKIAERSRLKQVEMAKKSLLQLEKSGELLLSQKVMILKALAKAISFR